MNIQKNKVFLLNLSNNLGQCDCVFTSKNENDYILVRKDNKKLFKICLNMKNQTEYYEKKIGLSDNLKEEIITLSQNLNLTYSNLPFNYDDFFVNLTPIELDRFEVPYTLYLDGQEDNLYKYEWVAKVIEISSSYFDKEIRVFIYREKNTITYGVLNNLEKIVKYVFKLENNILSLIREERYNGYKALNFIDLKNEFINLTTTSHLMQKDVSGKDDNENFHMKTFKKVFSIE